MSLNSLSNVEGPQLFNVSITVNASFEETLAALKQAIAAEELLLIHEIPVQSILATHGISIPATRQLLFFHPRYMQRILTDNASAIVEAPLKFAVMEISAETTIVRFIRPGYLFERYPGLETLGYELEEVVMKITSTLPN